MTRWTAEIGLDTQPKARGTSPQRSTFWARLLLVIKARPQIFKDLWLEALKGLKWHFTCCFGGITPIAYQLTFQDSSLFCLIFPVNSTDGLSIRHTSSRTKWSNPVNVLQGGYFTGVLLFRAWWTESMGRRCFEWKQLVLLFSKVAAAAYCNRKHLRIKQDKNINPNLNIVIP